MIRGFVCIRRASVSSSLGLLGLLALGAGGCAGDDGASSGTEGTATAATIATGTSTATTTSGDLTTDATGDSESTADPTGDPTTTATTTDPTASTTDSETSTTGDPELLDWQRGVINLTSLLVDQVAVGPDGSVAIAGYHAGSSDFGGPPVVADGYMDMYLVVYEPDGALRWQRGLSTGVTNVSADTLQIGVSVDSDGGVLLTGPFEAPTDFGAGPLTPEDDTDAFVARYTADGDLAWVTTFAGPLHELGGHAVADAAGNVYATGGFAGTMSAGVTLTSADPEETDIYLVKLDPQGSPLWAQNFGSLLDQRGKALAVAEGGDLILEGEAYGILDLGGGEVDIPCCTWSDFVARYDSDGNFKWATVLGDSSGYVEQDGLALADDGSIYAVSGAVDLSKLDGDGALLWSHALVGITLNDVAARAEGGVWVAATFANDASLDFGDGVPEAAAGRTAALVAYNADGGVAAKHLFQALNDGDSYEMRANGVAVGSDGAVVATYEVAFAETVTADFGLGEVDGGGFIVHRAPGF